MVGDGKEQLAVCERTFVRTSKGRPLPFTDSERGVLSGLVEAGEAGADDGVHFAEHKSAEGDAEGEPETLVATLTLSPQHTNFGNHVDHAALLSLASLAQPPGPERPTSYNIDYVSQGKVGDEVEVVRLGDGRGAVVRGLRGDLCRCSFGSYEKFEFS